MRSRYVLKYLAVIHIWVIMIAGLGDNALAAANSQNALTDLQNQIIALRNEFKARSQKADTDQLAIQENLTTKLKEILEKGQSTDAASAELKTKIADVASLLETYSDKIAVLEKAVDTLDSTINGTLNVIENNFTAIKKQGIKKATVTPDKSDAESPPLNFSEGQLFRAAYRFYMDGDYETAVAGFQKLLEDYPSTKLAGSAQYWIAESFVKLNDYKTAIQEYDLLMKKYPRDSKVPDAQYGKAAALLKLGNTAEAKTLLTDVIEHFPESAAAQKARNALETLP